MFKIAIGAFAMGLAYTAPASAQYIRDGDRICFAETNTCYRLSDQDARGGIEPQSREGVDVRATVQTPIIPEYEREGETLDTKRSDDFSGQH